MINLRLAKCTVIAFGIVLSAEACKAVVLEFDFEVELEQNSFTEGDDQAAQAQGVASRFSGLGLGSLFNVVAQIDIDSRYLTESDFSGPDDYGSTPYSWRATDTIGEFASYFDSIFHVEKIADVFRFSALAYGGYYSLNFSLNTTTWTGSLGISGEELYDWQPSLRGDIQSVRIQGLDPIHPVADTINTLPLLLLCIFGMAFVRRFRRGRDR